MLTHIATPDPCSTLRSCSARTETPPYLTGAREQEEYILVNALRACCAAGGGRILTLPKPALCSPRRWERHSVWRTNAVNRKPALAVGGRPLVLRAPTANARVAFLRQRPSCCGTDLAPRPSRSLSFTTALRSNNRASKALDSLKRQGQLVYHSACGLRMRMYNNPDYSRVQDSRCVLCVCARGARCTRGVSSRPGLLAVLGRRNSVLARGRAAQAAAAGLAQPHRRTA